MRRPSILFPAIEAYRFYRNLDKAHYRQPLRQYHANLTAHCALVELPLRKERLRDEMREVDNFGVILVDADAPASVELDYLDNRGEFAPWSGAESEWDSDDIAQARKPDRHYLSKRYRNLFALYDDWEHSNGHYLVESVYCVGGMEVIALVMMKPNIKISLVEGALKKSNIQGALCTVVCCVMDVGPPTRPDDDLK